MDNAPVISQTFGDLVLEGYSRAAVQSYWRIDQLHLGFDLGAHPWDFMGVPNWFISHTHLDHVAALPVYIARRRMMKMEPPTIYLPEVAVESVHHMLRSFVPLDRGRLPCQLKGVVDGDEIELSRETVVTVHKTKHTIPSVGYVVWERRKKLKPEFAHLTGDQIRDIRLAGTEVSAEIRVPKIGYTGDTTPWGLDNNPVFYEAEILISEMTFISPDHQSHLTHKHGHMHLDDYVARKDLFKNKAIVVGHLSTRYNDHEAMNFIERKFPDFMDGKLWVWL
ncbi:MAG: MBL fold metallo-hydrolase [Pirellulaceae bacterium]|nr:MBL fold metallo-hydrolase [Pirellulaceae bacterium]